MAHDISENSIQKVKSGLAELGSALDALANRPPPLMPEIRDRSISGNKIDGGIITRFQSSGIKDESSRLIVLVNDKGIVTDNIDVETLIGNTNVSGDLNVAGTIVAKKLHVTEFTADTNNERSTSLDFKHSEDNSIVNKGIWWSGLAHTKQFVFKNNPDRFWSSESIDLHRNASLHIDGSSVINKTDLGPTVRNSSLQKVGVLADLKTSGNLTVDESLFWKSDFGRLGIGTDMPNGQLGILGDIAEFVIDETTTGYKLGTWTSNDLELVTDDTTRIKITAQGHITLGQKGNTDTKVSVFGRLGVGVNNVSTDVGLEVSSPIRFQNKKFEVSDSYPLSGSYNLGDIVWNSNPQPSTFVGWVCVKEGTPGQWKTFGNISR